jgi:hypothetical protein
MNSQWGGGGGNGPGGGGHVGLQCICIGER